MSKELEIQKIKMKMTSTLKESEKWKIQYERLNRALQDALGQQ